MNITMDDTIPVTCKNCGGEVFGQAFNVRRLSPLMSPTGETQIAQIQADTTRDQSQKDVEIANVQRQAQEAIARIQQEGQLAVAQQQTNPFGLSPAQYMQMQTQQVAARQKLGNRPEFGAPVLMPPTDYLSTFINAGISIGSALIAA